LALALGCSEAVDIGDKEFYDFVCTLQQQVAAGRWLETVQAYYQLCCLKQTVCTDATK